MALITLASPRFLNNTTRPRLPPFILGNDNFVFDVTVSVNTPFVETLIDSGNVDDMLGIQSYVNGDMMLRENDDTDDDNSVIWLDGVIDVTCVDVTLDFNAVNTADREIYDVYEPEEYIDEDDERSRLTLIPEPSVDPEADNDEDEEDNAMYRDAINERLEVRIAAQRAVTEIFENTLIGQNLRLTFQSGVLIHFQYI